MFGYFFDFFFGRTVTRDDLGHLGGNPRFTPPRYDPVTDIEHGLAPDWKRYEREQEQWRRKPSGNDNMSDIVERLSSQATGPDSIFARAADEIKRLRKQNEEAVDSLSELNRQLADAREHLSQLSR